MSKTSKIILVTIIATCILLGLGYAAITNITLNIAGTASANTDQANFKVRFVGTPEVSDTVAATAAITADHTATISVQGLTTAGQFVTATYEIKNESQDLSADLNVATTNSNKEYFTITSKLDKSSLTAGETTTALVTVKLTRTPIDGDVSANIGVNLTAMPVQPGEEGTSRGINDFSSTPISRELNEYGFYYGVAYTSLPSEGGWFEGDTISIVVYESGEVEQYWNENLAIYYSADEVELSEKLIKFGSSEFNVSDDGYTLTIDDSIYELNEIFMDNKEEYTGKLNEYGFYYDVPYVWGFFGSTQTYIFHEDSTFSYFVGESYLKRGNALYSKGTITPGTYTPLTIIKNGARLLQNYNYAYRVSENVDYYDYVYITRNTTTGEYEYIDRFPAVHKDNDMYAIGDYLFTYKKGSENDYWKAELLTDTSILPDGFKVTDRTKTSYQKVWDDFNNVQVKDLSNLYAGCTKLIAPSFMPGCMENISGMFDGCTSLKSAPTIFEDVTNVTNTFRGCTSLEGEITINSNKITEYAGCFEGVDMSKITLTGRASNVTKNKLGSTGLNYEMLPEDEVEE